MNLHLDLLDQIVKTVVDGESLSVLWLWIALCVELRTVSESDTLPLPYGATGHTVTSSLRGRKLPPSLWLSLHLNFAPPSKFPL